MVAKQLFAQQLEVQNVISQDIDCLQVSLRHLLEKTTRGQPKI